MFLAAKVGVTAFKVGKIAVNTKETFAGLQVEIELWKVQREYYANYFEEVQLFVPPQLYTLALSRIKVLGAYIQRLLAKIEKAEGGDKKAKMMIIGKSSGEMGTSFAQDIAVMFGDLDECIQFSQVHITSSRIMQLKAIDAQLQALGQPGITSICYQQHYLSPSLNVVVQSRRLIFLLEWPLDKVPVGAKVPISWAIAGDIPYVNIDIQVSSLAQQAQDKAKKTFVQIAAQVHSDKNGLGNYTWEVPSNFVANNGKHANYFFRLSYNPADNKSSSTRFTSKVKGVTDTFKIYDPAKKTQETKSSQPTSTTSHPSQAAPSRAPSTSTVSDKSDKSEKSEKSEKGVMGKASGLVGGFKKKF